MATKLLNNDQIATIHSELGKPSSSAVVRVKDIITAGVSAGYSEGLVYRTVRELFTPTGTRGKYHFPNITGEAAPVVAPAAVTPAPAPARFNNAMSVSSVTDDEVYVPKVDNTYVKWGEYKTVFDVIKSKHFFPLYISGMSGNGKTFMVEQACAKAKREYVRVQISPETDEDDLIGGFRLINGETVFQKGPVIKAMEHGAILLIDEIDRATNKIMCLQGILEGKPVLLKKTGQMVVPADGFNVIATANTNGRGSEDGRYSAASIIDDAFLERFVATIDQPYATPRVEMNILKKHAEKFEVNDDTFLEKLIAWSTVIRKTFADEAIDDVISTRRLCHIVKTFSIFKDRTKAIELCTNRFDSETKTAFIDLYTKIDESTPTMEELINRSENTTETVAESAEPSPF